MLQVLLCRPVFGHHASLSWSPPINFLSFFVLHLELPASKHGTPEVKAAKMNEIRNLKDYDTFEEVRDEG